jgi:hypothetical protein
VLTIEWFDGPRASLTEVFASADDSPDRVRSYRDRGRRDRGGHADKNVDGRLGVEPGYGDAADMVDAASHSGAERSRRAARSFAKR